MKTLNSEPRTLNFESGPDAPGAAAFKVQGSTVQGSKCPQHGPRAGEVALKAWLIEEAARVGRHPLTVWLRLRAGAYPQVRERRVNRRVIFVSIQP